MASVNRKLFGWPLLICPIAPTIFADEGSNRYEATVRILDDIVMPQLQLKEILLQEAVKIPNDYCAGHATNGPGVIIYISTEPSKCDLKIASGFDKEILQAVDDIEKISYPQMGSRFEEPDRLATLNLRNVPIIDALKYITALASTTYQIRTNGTVVIGEMVFNLEARVYRYKPDLFGKEDRKVITSHIGILPDRKLMVLVNSPELIALFDNLNLKDLGLTRADPKSAASK